MKGSRIQFLTPRWNQKMEITVSIIRELKLEDVNRYKNDVLFPEEDKKLYESCETAVSTVQGIAQKLLNLLDDVCKSHKFWVQKGKSSPSKQSQFMLLEQGPWKFAVTLSQYFKNYFSSEKITLSDRASIQISERIVFLSSLRDRLSEALGEVYISSDKINNIIINSDNLRSEVSIFLQSIHRALSSMEGSYDLPLTHYSKNSESLGISTVYLHIQSADSWSRKIGSAMIDDQIPHHHFSSLIDDGIAVIKDDLERIELCTSLLMSHYRRPTKLSQNWMKLSGMSLACVVACGWIVKHSSLAGSDDLSRWTKAGRDSAAVFFQDHAITPILSIRAELLNTFYKRPNNIVQTEEVKFTQDSLHRMLVNFAQQVKPERVNISSSSSSSSGSGNSSSSSSNNMSEQELLEIVMLKYEQELKQPIKSLFGGELARSLLIQIQKLKLDIETAMLELDQILRANEINFAFLAALPTVAIIFILTYISSALYLDKGRRGREGRGRKAQLRRRMLMADVEKIIIDSTISKRDFHAKTQSTRDYGLLLLSLHKLFKSVKYHATATGEWERVREDILTLSEYSIDKNIKMHYVARLTRIYECLCPLPIKKTFL